MTGNTTASNLITCKECGKVAHKSSDGNIDFDNICIDCYYNNFKRVKRVKKTIT